MAQAQDDLKSGRAGDKSLFAAIRSAAPDGDRFFLKDVGGRTLTYEAMLVRTAQIANCLWAAGLRPGDRLAVQVETLAAFAAHPCSARNRT